MNLIAWYSDTEGDIILQNRSLMTETYSKTPTLQPKEKWSFSKFFSSKTPNPGESNEKQLHDHRGIPMKSAKSLFY